MEENNVTGSVQTGPQPAPSEPTSNPAQQGSATPQTNNTVVDPVSTTNQAQPAPAVTTNNMNTESAAVVTPSPDANMSTSDTPAVTAPPVSVQTDNPTINPTTIPVAEQSSSVPNVPQSETTVQDLGGGVQVTTVEEPTVSVQPVEKVDTPMAEATPAAPVGTLPPLPNMAIQTGMEGSVEHMNEAAPATTGPSTTGVAPVESKVGSVTPVQMSQPEVTFTEQSAQETTPAKTEAIAPTVETPEIKEITPEPQGPQSTGIPSGMTVGQDAMAQDPDPLMKEELPKLVDGKNENPLGQTSNSGFNNLTEVAPPATTQTIPSSDGLGTPLVASNPTGADSTSRIEPRSNINEGMNDLGSIENFDEDMEETKKKSLVESLMEKVKSLINPEENQ